MNRIIAVLFALSLSTAPVAAQQSYIDMVMGDYPSAYWPMDDPRNSPSLRELVGNLWTFPVWNAQEGLGSPGLGGSTSWHYNGPFQWTYQFAQYWQVDDTPAVDLEGPMAIEAWFKSDIPTDQWVSDIVQKIAAYGPGSWNSPLAGGGYILKTQYWAGGFTGRIAGQGYYDYVQVQGRRYIPAHEWHHVVMTTDGTTLSLYIDGVLDASTPIPPVSAGYPYVSGSPLIIGSSSLQGYWCEVNGGSYCWFDVMHGSIQHLALYKHPLTADRVRAHFDALMNGDTEILGDATKPEVVPARSEGAVSLLTLAEARERTDLYDLSGRKVRVTAAGVYFQRSEGAKGVTRRTVVVR